MRILSWITHAKKPLSVDELRYGLAVEYNDDDDDEGDLEGIDEENLLSPGSLVDVCAGLVVIDSTSQTIRLVHFTTQEYFDKERLHLFKGAEVDISRACLTYLSHSFGKGFPNPQIATKALQSHPFFNYAICHWFLHVGKVLSVKNPSRMFSKVVARFKSSPLRRLAPPSYYFTRFKNRVKRKTLALELASYLGLEELVTILLDLSTGSCPGMDTSLVFASIEGHLNVVKLLLQYGAQVGSTLEPGGNYNALGAACKGGHLSVVKLLIGQGANIHSGTWATTPPLHFAYLRRDPIMVDFLLKEGADVNARDCLGNTACHKAASRRSDIDIVKRLVDAHCDLEITNDAGETALHYAAGSLHPYMIMIEFLLDRGADASAKNKKGRTARDLLENPLWIVPSFDDGPEYQKKRQQVLQRLLQLEQKASAPAANDL